MTQRLYPGGKDLNFFNGKKFPTDLDHLSPQANGEGTYLVYDEQGNSCPRYFITGIQYIGRGIWNVKNEDGSTVDAEKISVMF